MATGALVPVEVSPGRTVMVPDYLVPRPQGGLALPSAAPPPVGPDQRLAFNSPSYESPLPGSQVDQGDVADFPAGTPLKPGTPEFRAHHVQLLHDQEQLAAQQQRQDALDRRKNFLGEQAARGYQSKKAENDAAVFAGRSAPNPGLVAPPAAVLARENPKQAQRTSAPAPAPGQVNPSELVRAGGPQSPGAGAQAEEGDPDANAYLLSRLRRAGRGGGPSSPGGMVPNTIKVERQPGEDLLPEYKWELGLESRPDLGREIDPTAEQPTIGTEDPITRERKTELWQATENIGKRVGAQFQREELARQELANVQHQQLLDQSSLIDRQLDTLAARRDRIAALQATADQRTQEAASMEPRTREQIWGSKGNVGRGIAMLAAVLGGAAQGLRGGPNAGWEMIKQSVDDTANDERQEAERRQQLGLSAKNDFEHALAIYGDVDMAMLDSKNRKLANTIAMTQQSLNDRGLDASAKDRALVVQSAARQQFLENRQQMANRSNGVALKEEVNYKQQAPTGGGGDSILKAYKDAAALKKAKDVILGRDGKPKVSPAELATLNATEADLAPLKEMLGNYKGADEIPGIAGRNLGSKIFRKVADVTVGEGSGTRALDTREERANRIIIDRARLAYRHQVTGAGGSDAEADRIDEAFAGARTKEDLQVAVRIADQTLAAHRKLIAGGSSGTEEPAGAPDSFQAEP